MKFATPMVILSTMLATSFGFPTPICEADVVLTTSTLDSADLDFDGAGSETDGALNGDIRGFSLFGATLPSSPEFANITEIFIHFELVSGSSLSARAGGITPPGIGINSVNDFDPEAIGSMNSGELLMISVGSTSTNGDQVVLSGIGYNSWRNFFPFSEVEVFGATFDGGQSILSGADGVDTLPEMVFDSGVNSAIIQSNGEPIRVSDIRISVLSAVPEPTSGAVLGFAAMSLLTIRRRRK